MVHVYGVALVAAQKTGRRFFEKAFERRVYRYGAIVFKVYSDIVGEGFHEEDILKTDRIVFAARFNDGEAVAFLSEILNGAV